MDATNDGFLHRVPSRPMTASADASMIREVRGAIGILEEDGRFLVIANHRDLGQGPELVWDLPGGTVGAGESIHDACVREMYEETGIPVQVKDLAFVVERFGFLCDDPDRRTMYFFFEVERAGDTDEGPQDSAVVDRAFHTPEELRELCDRDYHEDFFRWLASDRRRRYHLDRGRS